MSAPREYRFMIEGYTPATLPLERLAKYMTQLAKLFGTPEAVHFKAIEAGSVQLLQTVDTAHANAVQQRVAAMQAGEGATEAVKASEQIERLLGEDRASGWLAAGRDEVVMRFTPAKPVAHQKLGPVDEEGDLRGVLVKIDGSGRKIRGQLKDGDIDHKFACDETMAKALAPHLLGQPLRVYVVGSWQRSAGGQWQCTQFVARYFEVYEVTSLTQALDQIRYDLGPLARGRDLYAELVDLREDEETPD